MNEHIKIFSNSAIVINRIVQLLEDNKIHSLTKDNVESARLAGFGTSYFNVDLYVYKSDLGIAENIIKSFLSKK
jgi:hypothetical protein